MPTDKRRMLAEMMARMGGQDPAMNTAKMRNVGPDEPIEWDSFGTEPAPETQQQSSLLGLLGSLVTSEAAGTGDQVPQNMNDILLRILGAGVEDDVAKAQARELKRRGTGIQRM